MNTKKKFVFEVTVEDLPYNKATYKLLGDHFISTYPEHTLAAEMVHEFIQSAVLHELERQCQLRMTPQDVIAEAIERTRAYEKIRDSIKFVRIDP